MLIFRQGGNTVCHPGLPQPGNQTKGHPLDTPKDNSRHPRLAIPEWPVTQKCGEILDTDNPLAWEVAEPIFQSGINQVAILNRVEFVRAEPYLRPDSHLFALQLQGQTGLFAGGVMTWLTVGDLGFVPAGTPFNHTGKPRSPFSYIYITIADDERWDGLKRRGPWVRPYESADYLYLLVRRLLDAHVNRSLVAIKHALRDSFTLVDLLLRENHAQSQEDAALSLGFKELLLLIHANPGARWNNAEMASSMNLSERTFLRAFKQEFNTTPKTMIMRQRMIVARERLALSNDPIKAISQELGYANRRTFSQLFFEHVGMTPDDFRKSASPG